MKQIEHNGRVYKVGDTVTVYRRIESNSADGMGPLGRWDNVWIDNMDELIGKTVVISHIDRNGLRFTGHKPGFPLTAILPNTLKLKERLTTSPFQLKPFMRAVTRNGWQWIVAEHEALLESQAYDVPMYLIREDGNTATVLWPTTANPGFETLEIVEVYAPPEYIGEILTLKARGELLWHENYDVEQAAKAKALSALEQQRVDLEARIKELKESE